MTTKQFFKTYPGAIGVWKVGKRLFLHSFELQAQSYARKNGLTCEYVPKEATAAEAVNSQEETTTDGSE